MNTPTEIVTTQVFSRAGLGFLWSKRTELDPGQLSIINSLYLNKKKSTLDCEHTVKYKLASSKPGQLGYGRFYGSKGSLETLEKECRGTICKDFYHDIDVVNCHPVLLEQFAHNKYNRDLSEVNKLCQNREEYMKATGMPRDEAKTEIIRILYGGRNTIDFFIPLANEVRMFSKFLSGLEEYVQLWNYCIKQDNKYGTFLSFILQTEERKCMLVMKEDFEALGWSVDVLAYDGVMIRRREGISLVDDIKKVEKAINVKTGYNISLISKEFLSYDIPVYSEEIAPGVSLQAYNEMKSLFETNNFYYIPTNEMFQINGANVLRMSFEHAREYYSKDWRFTTSNKFGDYISFFDLWRKDASRRMINSIDMKESDDPSVFVMPPKFSWKNEGESTSIDLFLELIKLMGSSQQQAYIMNWLAHLIQKPFDLPGVALIITGLKGCGKDTLFDFISEYVIGTDYTTNYGDNNQFFSAYDTNRMNKFLIKLEEADRHICVKNASKLKSLITNVNEMFNPKGQKAIVVPNYNRYVFTSNKGSPVEMTDGERRFVIASCSPIKKNDFEFWSKVRNELFTAGAGKAVGEFLANYDISDFNPRVLPVDEYQQAVVDAEMSSEERFVEHWDGAECNMTEFFFLYRAYCTDNALPHVLSSSSLGIRLLTLLRDGRIIKKRSREGGGAAYLKPQVV